MKIKSHRDFWSGVMFVVIGAGFAIGATNFVFMTALFAAVGYALLQAECESAPLLLGFILGPMMEENLRRALLLSRGDLEHVRARPLSAGLLLAALLMVIVVTLPSIKSKREVAFSEE